MQVDSQGQLQLVEERVGGRDSIHGAAEDAMVGCKQTLVVGQGYVGRLVRFVWQDIPLLKQVDRLGIRISLMDAGRDKIQHGGKGRG